MKINLHKTDNTYSQPHFFIQAKGYNAGRPSAKSYSNSYVVLCHDEVEKGMLFWICFGLWKSNQFIPLKDKSIACILNPDDAARLIDNISKRLSLHPGEFIASVKELKELIHTEKLLSTQIKIIDQIKKSVVKRMLC